MGYHLQPPEKSKKNSKNEKDRKIRENEGFKNYLRLSPLQRRFIDIFQQKILDKGNRLDIFHGFGGIEQGQGGISHQNVIIRADINVQTVGTVEKHFVMRGRLRNNGKRLHGRVDFRHVDRRHGQPGQCLDRSISFMQDFAQKCQIPVLVQVVFQLGFDQVVWTHS